MYVCVSMMMKIKYYQGNMYGEFKKRYLTL